MEIGQEEKDYFISWVTFCAPVSQEVLMIEYPGEDLTCQSKSESKDFINEHELQIHMKIVNAYFDPYLYHETH